MIESSCNPMRKYFCNVILCFVFNERVEHFNIRRRRRNKIYDDRAAITRLTFAQLKFLRCGYVPLPNGFDRKYIHRLLH